MSAIDLVILGMLKKKSLGAYELQKLVEYRSISKWVRINPRVDLLDTPGIIPVKQVEQEKALKLAFVDSIGENAYDLESISIEFLKLMLNKYPSVIKNRYGIEEQEEEITLETIAVKRNLIGQNSKPDTLRAASMLMNDFRDGRLGKLTLDDEE